MTVKIIPSTEFSRQFKRLSKKYKSLVDDYFSLSKSLKENPTQGILLSNRVRKVRMPISSKGKGKSGSARVLTLVVQVSDESNVTLLTIYDKNEISNVTDSYIKWLVEHYR